MTSLPKRGVIVERNTLFRSFHAAHVSGGGLEGQVQYLATGPPTFDIVVIAVLASRKQYLATGPPTVDIVVIAVLASRKPFVYESSGPNTMSMHTLSCLSIEAICWPSVVTCLPVVFLRMPCENRLEKLEPCEAYKHSESENAS
nr:hypothetical protein Iba_chr06fCG2150 [Ipomoea batatas]